MFANDFGGHFGTHWNVPNFWGNQHPYFCGFGSIPQNQFGLGSIPQNHFGFGSIPYHNNFTNVGTQHTGWNLGQTIPQTTMTSPFYGLNSGFSGYNTGPNFNTMPFNVGYTNQGYTPYFPNFQNFQNFHHPFQGCR